MVVALTAPSCGEVEFQRYRAAHCRDRSLHRGVGEQRASEIGVQHRPGKIVDRAQRRALALLQPTERC